MRLLCRLGLHTSTYLDSVGSPVASSPDPDLWEYQTTPRCNHCEAPTGPTTTELFRWSPNLRHFIQHWSPPRDDPHP